MGKVNDPRWRSAAAFRRQMSYRSITEWREAELADARTALAEATWLLHEARERAIYHGWNGSASRAYHEAAQAVKAARRRVWQAKWRGMWAGIRARLSGLMSL